MTCQGAEIKSICNETAPVDFLENLASASFEKLELFFEMTNLKSFWPKNCQRIADGIFNSGYSPIQFSKNFVIAVLFAFLRKHCFSTKEHSLLTLALFNVTTGLSDYH